MGKSIKMYKKNTKEKPSLFKTILTSWLLFGNTKVFAGLNSSNSTNASDQIHWNNGTGNLTNFRNLSKEQVVDIASGEYAGCDLTNKSGIFSYTDWQFDPSIALYTGTGTKSRLLRNFSIAPTKWGEHGNQPYVDDLEPGTSDSYNGDYTAANPDEWASLTSGIIFPFADMPFENQRLGRYIYKHNDSFDYSIVTSYSAFEHHMTVGWDDNYIKTYGTDFNIPRWIVSTNNSEYAPINNLPIRNNFGLRHIQWKHPFIPPEDIVTCSLDNIDQGYRDLIRCVSIAFVCNKNNIILNFVNRNKFIRSKGGQGLGANLKFTYPYISTTSGLSNNVVEVYISLPLITSDKDDKIIVQDKIRDSIVTAYTRYAIDGTETWRDKKQYKTLNDWKGCANSVAISDNEWKNITQYLTFIEADKIRNQICPKIIGEPPLDYLEKIAKEIKTIASITTSLMKLLDKLKDILLPPEEEERIEKLVLALETPEIIEAVALGIIAIPIIGVTNNDNSNDVQDSDILITEDNLLEYILKAFDNNNDTRDALSEFNISRNEINDLYVNIPKIIDSNNTDSPPVPSSATKNEVNQISKYLVSTATNVLKNFNKISVAANSYTTNIKTSIGDSINKWSRY